MQIVAVENYKTKYTESTVLTVAMVSKLNWENSPAYQILDQQVRCTLHMLLLKQGR